MNNYVQDPGIENAYRHFETNDEVAFLIHPAAHHDYLSLSGIIHKRLLEIKERPGVSFSSVYVHVKMNRDEFDKVVIPLVESGDVKHIHIDREVQF
jgi:hypothetical protein